MLYAMQRMLRATRVILFSLVVLPVVFTAVDAHAKKKNPINLSVKDADVRSVLTFIADSAGMNMVISDGVTGNVTLTLKAVPARTALRAVLRARALQVVEEGNVWMVMTDAEYDQRQKRRRP